MTVTAATLRADLEKAFKARHITVDPDGAARVALGVVLPHFRALAAEIERLREEITAVRAHALLNGVRLADLERLRDAARAGKGGVSGEAS